MTWNLLGIGAPILVALIAIPQLIHWIGIDRFGVLTLAWAVVGYVGLFDIGLGRALTKLTAEVLGQKRDTELLELFWSSMVLTGLLGLVGMAAFGALAPWLVKHVLKIPGPLVAETLRAFYVLSLSVPLVICAAGLRGFLEAHQRFDLVNIVRIPLGVFTYAGPLLVLPFSRSLYPIVTVLTLGRAVASIAYVVLCFHINPQLSKRIAWSREKTIPLLRSGGWMTISNVISSLMVVADRFVIGALLSVAAVAYYATSFEVVTKVLVIPAAIAGVLFPAFSASYSLEPGRTAMLFQRGTKYTFLILFPILLGIAVFAREGLSAWLGTNVASHSVRALEWLAAGVLLNGLAQIPFSLVQGIGRPDLTAKLHIMEFLVYAVLLWLLIRGFGIEGAAIAWTIRAALDALALFILSRHLLGIEHILGKRAAALGAAALCLMLIGDVLPGLLGKTILFGATMVAFVLAAWLWMLSPTERDMVQRRGWRVVEVSP
jgi:O-antigen/teichoic acid export membrane protein